MYNIYSHLPFADSFPGFSLACSQVKRREELTHRRKRGYYVKYFRLSARNRAGTLYEMYNLAGYTVVSRNLRSCKPTPRPVFRRTLAGAQRPSGFYLTLRYPRSLAHEISLSSHMRRTRRHVFVGEAATRANLPARCRSAARGFR